MQCKCIVFVCYFQLFHLIVFDIVVVFGVFNKPMHIMHVMKNFAHKEYWKCSQTIRTLSVYFICGICNRLHFGNALFIVEKKPKNFKIKQENSIFVLHFDIIACYAVIAIQTVHDLTYLFKHNRN